MTPYQAPKHFVWLQDCNEVHGKRKTITSEKTLVQQKGAFAKDLLWYNSLRVKDTLEMFAKQGRPQNAEA